MSFILIAINADGRVRCAQSSHSYVPDDFVRPGDFAFTVKAEDVRASHMHGLPAVDHPVT